MASLKALPSKLATYRGRLRPSAKFAEPFYQSKAWRSLVARRKLDPDYFVALRRAKHGERLILDHVTERKDGGEDLDPNNTQWLTHSEHQTKTARERARRAKGVGGDQKSGGRHGV